jgi:hypothetical protein
VVKKTYVSHALIAKECIVETTDFLKDMVAQLCIV